jgi:signal transduction histidine kinase
VVIAAVMVAPFLFALLELDALRRSTRQLIDSEFAGSQRLTSLGQTAEEIRKMEIRFTFGTNPEAYSDSITAAHRRLVALSDSLRRSMPGSTFRLDSAAYDLGVYVEQVVRIPPGARNRAAVIDSVWEKHLMPAIETLLQEVPRLQQQLTDRAAEYFAGASIAAERAERAGIIGLAVAFVLAGGIGIWLTRSISEPVRDLERGMRTVSDGDYSYQLREAANAPEEFSRLSDSYRSMVEQLAELDKLKAEFVSIASHELRTPLNVVMGYVQLLEDGAYGPLNEKQLELCRVLQTQVQSLTRLADQLLDVSRFEAGGGRIEPRNVSVAAFASRLESTFAVLAIQRGITFRVTSDTKLPEFADWDEDRLGEAIGNLLSNSLKFTQRGGSVDLSLYTETNGVRFEVRDTGPGIPGEQLPRIFEKFYQADGQGDTFRKGSGLGLAIAREIIEAHQGTISAESELGVGTTFFVRVPTKARGGRAVLSRRLTPATRVPANA